MFRSIELRGDIERRYEVQVRCVLIGKMVVTTTF